MISVIIPVYNGEKYINNILNDLSKQILRDFEAIFVDDGSIDNSYELLKACKDSEKFFFAINVIRQENKGVSSARNTGIENSKGEYICFVDVDDNLTPDYLSHMYSLIQSTNASIVFCKTTSLENINKEKEEILKEYTSYDALKSYLFFDLVSGACSLMIIADIIRKNNLRFKDGYKYSEDLHMVWRMLAYCDKIVETNKILYIYKVNEGSAMSKFNCDRMDSIKLMEDLEIFFKKNKIEFFPLFKRYGKARIAWSLLWQAAYNLQYAEFKKFIKTYDFKKQLKKLFVYKQKHVSMSSFLFCISTKIYYYVAKIASRKFRKIS